MVKIIFILCLAVMSINARATVTDEFRNNIASLDNLAPISYKKLSPVEKQVVNYAINGYLNNFVMCESGDFARGKNKKIYEVKNYKKNVLFRNSRIDDSDRLNGVLWRGDIIVFLGGAAREVMRGNGFGLWSNIGGLTDLEKYGDDGGLYAGTLAYYKNDLYVYSNGLKGLFTRSNANQLTCQEINYFMSKDEPVKLGSPNLFSIPYTETALDLKRKLLTIKLKINILESGLVERIDVVKSTGLGTLDIDIKNSMKRQKFNPYIEGGVAKRTYFEQEYLVRHTTKMRDLIKISSENPIYNDLMSLNANISSDRNEENVLDNTVNQIQGSESLPTIESNSENSINKTQIKEVSDLDRAKANLCMIGVKSQCP